MIITDINKLTRPSRTVDLIQDKSLIEEVKGTLLIEMGNNNCLGLSAVQVGYDVKIFSLNVDPVIYFINPRILSVEGRIIYPKERCLSLPGVCITTLRYKKIEVEDDENGRLWYNNYSSIVIQHEIDHLNGILIYNRKYFGGGNIGRNDLCYCGSGKKYKKCCLLKGGSIID